MLRVIPKILSAWIFLLLTFSSLTLHTALAASVSKSEIDFKFSFDKNLRLSVNIYICIPIVSCNAVAEVSRIGNYKRGELR